MEKPEGAEVAGEAMGAVLPAATVVVARGVLGTSSDGRCKELPILPGTALKLSPRLSTPLLMVVGILMTSTPCSMVV